MLKRNWNNIIFDEFFFYEFSKCQFRGACMINKKLVRNQYCVEAKKIKPIKVKGYHHYDDTLKYLILKKITFVLSDALCKGDNISLNWFKKMAAIIIEKEISFISKKAHNRSQRYFQAIRESVTEKLEGLFKLIDTDDFSDSLESCVIKKINLKEYLDSLTTRLNTHTLKIIPEFNFESGSPLLKHEILSMNYKEEKESLEIVITHLFDLNDDTLHRNFFLNILFNHFYYVEKNIMNKNFDIEIKRVDKIIVYNPLTLKRKEVLFEDVKGTLSEMDMFRIMKAYIDNNLSRSLNHSECPYCENKEFCEVRTRSNNKEALKSVLRNANSKKIIEEMI